MYARSNPEKAQLYIDQAISLAYSVGNDALIGEAHMNAGNFYAMQANYETSETFFAKAKEIFQRTKDSIGLAKVSNNLSKVLFFKGDLEASLASGIEAIQINERPGADKSFLIGNYMAVGNVLASTEDFERSLKYYQQAEKLANELDNPLRMAQVRHNLGENMNWLKRHEEAIPYFEENVAFYTESNNQFKLASTLNSLGTVYFDMKAYKQAQTYLEDSYALTKKLGDTNGMAFNARGLGRLHMLQGNSKSALSFFSEGMEISKSSGATGILAADFRNVSNAYEGLGDYKNAYIYRVKHQKLNDSIFNIESVSKLNELEIKYQTAKKEGEILTLNAQAKSDRLTKTLYGIGMFSFVAIAGLLLFGFKQRLKKNRIEREKQEEIFKQELDFKKKELTSQTLHLVQKNTFIQELRENLERIKNSPELFKIEFRRIILLLKRENSEDKDWEVFKSYFSEVHNSFDNTLRSITEDLTEKEIRLAAFLRMNLSTKEIASMLNVLPDSVLKSKYRLKKKLKIDKEIDLTSFLNNI